MNSQEKARYRKELLEDIERRVIRDGYAEVTDLRFLDLDEEREPNSAKVMEMLITALLSNSACALDIPEPKTLHGELKELCTTRGWEILYDPIKHEWWVRRGPMKIPCSACEGRGHERISLLPFGAEVCSEAMTVRYCEVCHGTREVTI